MTDLLRPIIGIENRTAQEVFDIMSDRFRSAHRPVEQEAVLPCDVVVGHITYRQGVKFEIFADAARRWFAAYKEAASPPSRALSQDEREAAARVKAYVSHAKMLSQGAILVSARDLTTLLNIIQPEGQS